MKRKWTIYATFSYKVDKCLTTEGTTAQPTHAMKKIALPYIKKISQKLQILSSIGTSECFEMAGHSFNQVHSHWVASVVEDRLCKGESISNIPTYGTMAY